MDISRIRKGLTVKTADTLGTTKGFIMDPSYKAARRSGAVGQVVNYVPGHGGDVWYVQHNDDGEIAAYAYNEFSEFRP